LTQNRSNGQLNRAKCLTVESILNLVSIIRVDKSLNFSGLAPHDDSHCHLTFMRKIQLMFHQ